MALCQITGTVQLPDGTNAAGRILVFKRNPETVVAQSGHGIVPDEIAVKVAADGAVDFRLYTANYIGFLRNQRQGNERVFAFPVPEAATALFQDILQAVDPVEPLPSWLTEAFGARDDAEGFADDAEAEADRAEAASLVAQSRTDIVLTTAFGVAGATLDTLTYSTPGVAQGATLRDERTNELYEVVASNATTYDYQGSGGLRVIKSSTLGVTTLGARVPASPITDTSSTMMRSIRDPSVSEIDIPAGNWRFDNPINITGITRNIKIRGAGKNKSVISFNHNGQGLRLEGVDGARDITLEFEDFAVNRPGYASYTGVIGPKSVYGAHAKHIGFLRLDEAHGIGFGINSAYADSAIFKENYAHDHFGGMGGPTGTDGIHSIYVRHTEFIGNVVERVGDDGISCGGTYDGTTVVTSGKSYGNTVRDVGGSMQKLYNSFRDWLVFGNYAENTHFGVYTSTEEGVDQIIQDGLTAYGNEMRGVGGASGEIAGMFRVRFWPGRANAIFRNFNIYDNVGIECRSLFNHTTYSTGQILEDLRVSGNKMLKWARRAGGTGNEVMALIRGGRGLLDVSDNDFTGIPSGGGGIYFQSELSGGGAARSDYEVKAHRNRTEGGGGAYHLWVRQSNLRQDIQGNVFKGAVPLTGGQNSYMTLAAPRPDSIIEGNQGDGAMAVSSPIGNRQTNDLVRTNAIPTTGTHHAGTEYTNTVVGVVAAGGWRVLAGGTFGTLTGVTADVVLGAYNTTVNDASGLLIGQYVTVAGAGWTRARIINIVGNVLTFSTASTASVTGAAVSYVAPTFALLPAYTATT